MNPCSHHLFQERACEDHQDVFLHNLTSAESVAMHTSAALTMQGRLHMVRMDLKGSRAKQDLCCGHLLPVAQEPLRSHSALHPLLGFS